ncbi:N-acetyllactosaminide beta-1:3-N-acetylglucosaminyltransferase-like protein [Dinothrombium tinctorium]|uniref:N-acetyllactosaminide beta-1:3-N-acetylglucosaminyltransferase-like protein n=1 Tax=Dinothrombium tinctorium TaxID=1965070 RepID=A0A3S4QPI2_9ACAR|nr:N-acetyllactosaminide beta-1:3-N-acetylglucosaminyltransferase-like protein [Dinothrombium tinctorium]RWS06099.1 N-acetyllactosaminide beta-1:3-N-acetylglucosaminyltransferase-like protein [Dinothrombium tinctorium]
MHVENENAFTSNITKNYNWWKTEERNGYLVIREFIPSDTSSKIEFNNSITLCTQATIEFLDHVEELCDRWKGPISAAVYAPGSDFMASINVVYFLRKCREECIRKHISWHFIYDKPYGPSFERVTSPNSYVDHTLLNCSLSFKDLLSKFKEPFRKENKLHYPINVARNVARLSARTKYILVSDIELYPSINIIPMFLDLLKNERNDLIKNVKINVPHVYVLPIFEVKSGFSAPHTKAELLKMIEEENAIFFHKWICSSCQNFPGREKWIRTLPLKNTLNVLTSAKRVSSLLYWEPLYIGTNAEPLYEERLSWEGKMDKMSQVYEMCLLNYDFLILDNAFLVHAPGIKLIDPKDKQRRLPYIERNEAIYNDKILELKSRYTHNGIC